MRQRPAGDTHRGGGYYGGAGALSSAHGLDNIPMEEASAATITNPPLRSYCMDRLDSVLANKFLTGYDRLIGRQH